MQLRYVAYGLQLCSSFELPGMGQTVDTALPTLALELVDQGMLERAWSGSDGSRSWRGRLGDGCTLEIAYGSAGDHLFTYGRRALFRLDRAGSTLSCAPRRSGLDWQRALLSKVLTTVSVLRGYEALHASAVDSPFGVVAIAAPSGAGKTTLALELAQRGWPLLSDDVLVLGRTQDAVHAYPGTPHANIAVDGCDSGAAVPGSVLGTLAGELWLAVGSSASRPGPVAGVCLLERGATLSLDAEVLPSSPLPLAPYMLGLEESEARARERFGLYADLTASATLLRLTGGRHDRPDGLAVLLQETLAERPAALAAGGVA